MEKDNDILNELKTVAPGLLPIPESMPYGLPEGYFEHLPVALLLKTCNTKNTLAVPAFYFDNFAGRMLQKLRSLETEAELEEISPLLKSIGKKTPMTVPDGYFDTIAIPATTSPETIKIPLVTSEETTPVVPMQPKRRWTNWVAAACVVAIAGFFGVKYITNTPGTTTPPELAVDHPADSLDSLATEEISHALAALEDNSLRQELRNLGVSEDAHSTLFYLETDNFEKAIQSVSNQELDEYGYLSGLGQEQHKKS